MHNEQVVDATGVLTHASLQYCISTVYKPT